MKRLPHQQLKDGLKSEVGQELMIRAWRVVPIEMGILVFVDPRKETMVLKEGMDPNLMNSRNFMPHGNVEAGLQLDLLEAYRAEVVVKERKHGKGGVCDREDDRVHGR